MEQEKQKPNYKTAITRSGAIELTCGACGAVHDPINAVVVNNKLCSNCQEIQKGEYVAVENNLHHDEIVASMQKNGPAACNHIEGGGN